MSTLKEWKEDCNIIHNNTYDYSLIDEEKLIHNRKLKAPIICKKHGIFMQRAYSHKQGKGCPICNESTGEKLIALLLDSHNISYDREFSFFECKDIFPLPFDFKLENDILIEYDGIQHFKEKDFFGGKKGFEILQRHDQIKTEYCQKNGLTLIRIPYTMTPELIEKTILNEIEKMEI